MRLQIDRVPVYTHGTHARTHAHYTVKITKSSLVYQFQFYNLLLLLIYENIKLGHRDSISQQVLTAGL